MKAIIIFFLLTLSIPSFSQKIEKFYTYDWKETTAPYARFYALIEKQDSLWQRRDYYIYERKLQMEGYYKDSNCSIAHGAFRYYHSNGRLESAGKYTDGKKSGTWLGYHSNGMMEDSMSFQNGKITGIYLGWHRNGYQSDSAFYLPDGSGTAISWFDNGVPSHAGKYTAETKPHGTWTFFHRNGKLSSREVYDHGKLLSMICYDEKGQPDDTIGTDRPAEFPGGIKGWQKFMNRHLYFPDQYTIVNSDKIVVVIIAQIDEEGNVTNTEVEVSFHPDFDKIALNIFKRSPKWAPAMSHNRKVKYFVRQAVYFSQPDNEDE